MTIEMENDGSDIFVLLLEFINLVVYRFYTAADVHCRFHINHCSLVEKRKKMKSVDRTSKPSSTPRN